MSEKEISVTTDGIVLKGDIVDSVSAPISTVCKTADTILKVVDNVVGLPADFLNHHLRTFREAYTEGYVKIPLEQRIEPTLKLGCSVLKNVAYSAEEPELQKLFAQLLLSASDTNYAEDVHPGFATVINEMTPYEAEVLNIHFGNSKQIPNADFSQLQKAYSNLVRLGLIAYRQRDYTEKELTKFIGKSSYNSPRRVEDLPKLVVDIINDLQKLKKTVIEDRHKSTMPGRSELALTEFGSDFIRVVCEKVC